MSTGQSALLDHVFGGNKALYETVGLLPLVTVGVYGINYAAKSISSKFAKKATQEIAEETAERLARESIEEAAEKALLESGEEAAKKTAMEAGEEVSEKAAMEAGEEVAEKTAMEAADNTDQINTTTQEVAENQNSGVYLERGSESGSKSRRLQEVIVNNAPVKGDMINIRNIYNELNKSEVGRETLDYLMKNEDITVNFYYHLHPNEDGLLGRIVDRNIDIYVPAHPINTKVNVTKTLIHETTHASINSLRNTRKEEVICFVREVLHDNNGITPEEVKKIIRDVNLLYEELPWR